MFIYHQLELELSAKVQQTAVLVRNRHCIVCLHMITLCVETYQVTILSCDLNVFNDGKLFKSGR